MIRKYGELEFKRLYYSKRHSAFDPLSDSAPPSEETLLLLAVADPGLEAPFFECLSNCVLGTARMSRIY